MKHLTRIAAITALVLATGLACSHPAATLAQSPLIGGCPILPANNIWNTPIDTLPVDEKLRLVEEIWDRIAAHPEPGTRLLHSV